MQPSLKVYDETVLQFINSDFTIENLDNNCQFTEGPVWNNEGYYLFSDITANCIYKLAPSQPKEVYANFSGTTNKEDEDFFWAELLILHRRVFTRVLEIVMCIH